MDFAGAAWEEAWAVVGAGAGFPADGVNCNVGQLKVPLSGRRCARALVGSTYVTELLDEILVLLRAHRRPISSDRVRPLVGLGWPFCTVHWSKVATSRRFRPDRALTLVANISQGSRQRSGKVVAPTESICRRLSSGRKDAATFRSWLQFDRAYRLT